MDHSNFNKIDYSFPIEKVYPVAALVFFLSIIIFAVPFVFIHDLKTLTEGLNHFIRIKVFLPAIIGGTIIHELLHGAVIFTFGRVSFRDIKFGFQKETYTPYAHCAKPVKAIVYMLSTAAPGIILGIVPAIISLFTANAFLLIFGIIFTFAASGDIFILWKIKSVKSSELVQDHPDLAGCYVYQKK